MLTKACLWVAGRLFQFVINRDRTPGMKLLGVEQVLNFDGERFVLTVRREYTNVW